MTDHKSGFNSGASDSDEISLKDLALRTGVFYRYFLSNWKIIVLGGILGGLLGLGYSFLTKPTYIATTTFVLESGEGGGLGRYAAMAAMAGIDIGGGGGGLFQGDNILGLYKSRAMVQKALLSNVEIRGKKQLLIDYYVDVNNLRENWKKDEKLKNLNFRPDGRGKFSRVQDSIMARVVEDINTIYLSVDKPDKKLSIIQVEVRFPDEEFSKALNEQIVATVNNFYIDTKTKKSLESVKILQKQTDSVRAVMNGAIYSTASITDATPNLNPTKQVLRAPAQRSQFNAETNKAILAELVKNLEISKMSQRMETPLIQIIDQPQFPLPKEGLGKKKGLIIGGLLFGFLTVLFLFVKKLIADILK